MDNSEISDNTKIIYDPIHKVIKLHPLWVKIIDTPEFQRLRYIKQLGCSYFVYPSAMHTRFEHSIGVCYLAWRLAKALQEQVGKKEITDRDVLCVSIAGLCHDLGHGPFSHTWEIFLKKAESKEWKHEEKSIKIFDRIWDDLVDKKKLTKSENLTDSEKKLIHELIRGENTQPKYENKKYLFEIVANKKNGVDVDKWDYFARDAYAVGTNMSFDHERLIQTARIIPVKNKEGVMKKSICYRSTEVVNFYHMFYIRRLLHHRVYNHRVGRIIESMVVEALMHANEKLLDNGKKLSELPIEDFLKLDDSIFQNMLKLPENDKAKEIIERIQKRRLYKSVGCALTNKKKEDFNVKDIEKNIKTNDLSLAVDDYYVDIVGFNYGRDDDPVKNISFFYKNGEIVDDVEDITPTLMLTENFHETKISFVCRDTTIQDKLTEAFERWFKNEHETGKYKNEKDKTEQDKTKPVLRKSH